jgi:hypothetical protein
MIFCAFTALRARALRQYLHAMRIQVLKEVLYARRRDNGFAARGHGRGAGDKATRRRVDTRSLVGTGLGLTAGSFYLMTGWTPDISQMTIIVRSGCRASPIGHFRASTIA